MSASRYERQRRFAPVGDVGQQRIQQAHVLVVGVGALGSVVVELLARAGVGHLRVVDRDVVEWSNLQRQSLYTEADAREGVAKVQAAARHIAEINSEIVFEPFASDVSPRNIASLAVDIDLIIDGTDNFETRFLINDFALEKNLPWVHGGCVGSSGQVFTFRPGKTICLRCLMRTAPDPSSVETCDTAGVLGPATHQIASMQAMQALRLITEGDDAAVDSHLIYADLWDGRFQRIDTEGLRSNNCPACQQGRREYLSGELFPPAPMVLCGRNAVQLPPREGHHSLPLADIAHTWQGLGTVHQSRFLVRLGLSSSRSITLFRDGRAVIEGTQDPAEARSLYARFVGN